MLDFEQSQVRQTAIRIVLDAQAQGVTYVDSVEELIEAAKKVEEYLNVQMTYDDSEGPF